MPTMREVLFVSKPLAPPWNDSSKNLAREVARNLIRHRGTVMTQLGRRNVVADTDAMEVYPDRATSFSPKLSDNARVAYSLLTRPTPPLWHFFFAPNPRAAFVAGTLSRVRRKRSIQTLCSLPRTAHDLRTLMFADVSVALSRASYARFSAAGLGRSALRRIPPALAPLTPPSAGQRMAFRRSHGLPESAQVWIYPGDIELGGGAEVSLDALAAHQTSDVVLVMACRDKTPQAQAVRVRLKAKARRLGVSERVRWYGETTGIHELLACSDFVLLPNRTPYAKMDYPLVALEAMSLERPVLVGGRTPASELAEDGGAVAVEADGEAVSQAVDVLSGDDTEREALQARARALVIDSFDPRTVASQYERLYDDL